jgi:tetratricopeptide (TPR) repeat protein
LLIDISREVKAEAQLEPLYRLLLPYAERNAVNPPGACIGSVSRSLAVAASALGRDQQAIRHFQKAAELNDAMGARPASAATRCDYGEVLLRCGDRPQGRKLLGAARDEARALGMTGLRRKAEALLDSDLRISS